MSQNSVPGLSRRHQCTRCHCLVGPGEKSGTIICNQATGEIAPVLKADTEGDFDRCPYRGGVVVSIVGGVTYHSLLRINEKPLTQEELIMLAQVARTDGRKASEAIETELRLTG